MKKVNILVLAICFVFVFSSFVSFAEVSSGEENNAEKIVVSTDSNIPEQSAQSAQTAEQQNQAQQTEEQAKTVQDMAYELQELDNLLKIDDFSNIENEQNTVVKNAYKFKRIDKTNLCMTLLMIKRYLNSRDNYYKSEFARIKVIMNYKKKQIAEKAILKLEKRFAAQKAVDLKIHAKLVEIKKYIIANQTKLSAKQKEIIKSNLQAVLAKLIKHRQTLAELQAAVQKAKDMLVQKPAIDKKKLIDKAKNIKQKIVEKKEVIKQKKEDIKKKIADKLPKNQKGKKGETKNQQ